MKSKLTIALSAVMLLTAGTAAAEGLTYKPYGFVRNYAVVDSRATKSLSEDLFFFLPLDKQEVGGQDINDYAKFNFQAITTRLGLDISGYTIGSAKVSAKIEADFYCLNSSGNTGILRMRQAYANFAWDKVSLKVGQTWHPMAADMPNCINLETGAPFGPFNRSAQIMMDAQLGGGLTLTAGFLEQLQYRSAGPKGSSNLYQRYAILPEIYAGLSLKTGGLLARAGVDILSIKPQYGFSEDGKKYTDWLTTVSPFVFAQYTDGSFQIKAKSILAQAGEHMQLNSGYVVTGLKDDGISKEYAPIRTSASFISAQYGKTWQLMGMLGYYKNLGTTKDVIDGQVYYSGNGFNNIDQIIRFTPTVVYNCGKLQLGLEYDITTVNYGAGFDVRMKVTEDLHWVTNHRLLALMKLSF